MVSCLNEKGGGGGGISLIEIYGGEGREGTYFLDKIYFCGHSSFFAKEFAMIHEFCPVRDAVLQSRQLSSLSFLI